MSHTERQGESHRGGTERQGESHRETGRVTQRDRVSHTERQGESHRETE